MQQHEEAFQNYEKKIKPKLANSVLTPEDFNSLIVLLNWCFITKNDFFIDNFNRKFVRPICTTYNQIKTNILTKDETDIFHNISEANLKQLKYILYQYVNNFDAISANETNTELCLKVSKQSIKNCVHFILEYLKGIQKK